MTSPNEPVRLASGTLVDVQMWSSMLADAGIDCKVVGDELAGSLGTALEGSVDLWVHTKDLKRATELIEEYDAISDESATDLDE